MRFQKNYKVLDREFYDRSPEIVAKELLGKYLTRVIDKQILQGKIVETEAYLPFNDPAAHSFCGKTERNKSTFGPPGHAYVHRSRHHFLLDIVTLGINVPGSVLIRALEPISGIEIMKRNRKTNDVLKLTSGPAKLCSALAISIREDGLDVTTKRSGLFISENREDKKEINYLKVRRIGISKAKDLLLRYYIKNNPYVSVRGKIDTVDTDLLE